MTWDSTPHAFGEVFWGDDRLDDAISWLRHGRIQSK
jgi:hypothetical protein